MNFFLLIGINFILLFGWSRVGGFLFGLKSFSGVFFMSCQLLGFLIGQMLVCFLVILIEFVGIFRCGFFSFGVVIFLLMGFKYVNFGRKLRKWMWQVFLECILMILLMFSLLYFVMNLILGLYLLLQRMGILIF